MIKKLLLIPVLVLLMCGCSISIGYDYYEYKDLEGNVGTASDCWYSYGSFFCKLDDETRIQVQEFKGVIK